MNDLDKLIEKRKVDFETWERQKDEYLLCQFQSKNIDNETERDRIFFQTNELLTSIAEIFFSYTKFKDEWDTSECYLMHFGQCILLRSKKMDITFRWGVDMDEFYLETFIMHSENLRFMPDEFWGALLQLKDLGVFEYQGGGGLEREQRPFFENKTSVVFQVIRTFMLNQIERFDNSNTRIEFGTLVLKWKMDGNWPLLLEKACKAFRIAYRINYQLWKVRDLANKRRQIKSFRNSAETYYN